MLKRILSAETGMLEFFAKFIFVMLVVMPGCVFGGFWAGAHLDELLNISFFKLILPFVGTLLGIAITIFIIMIGHFKQRTGPMATKKPYSDELVSRHEFYNPADAPKTSIPRAGDSLPFKKQEMWKHIK